MRPSSTISVVSTSNSCQSKVTTKKIVIIVLGIVVAVGLLMVLIVGGIVGFALYQFGNSDAAVTAKEFLRKSERLKQDIGNVKDFGSLVSGNVSVQNAEGYANLSLKVIGERRTVNASVELIYHSGKPWRVTSASYKNEAGQMIELLNAYESRIPISDLGFEISELRFQISDNLRSQISDLRSQNSCLRSEIPAVGQRSGNHCKI